MKYLGDIDAVIDAVIVASYLIEKRH